MKALHSALELVIKHKAKLVIRELQRKSMKKELKNGIGDFLFAEEKKEKYE